MIEHGKIFLVFDTDVGYIYSFVLISHDTTVQVREFS